MMVQSRFAPFAWGVLAVNVLVILWGAFVRATGSGAGCGSHWPLCNGQVIPRPERLETLIELSHRASSGVALLLVVALALWAWRAFAPGHRVRRAAWASLALMIVEALIGAGLVLLELVAANVSVARAYWVAGHLINTFLLLAALTLTAWWGSGQPGVRLRGQGAGVALLAAALLGMLILGASGGIIALGDTLVLTAGISPDSSPVVAALVDLRVYHPAIAFGVGGLLALAAWRALRSHPSPQVRRLVWALAALYVGQLLLGALNVALLAPVPLQLLHLLLADLIWIVLVLLAAAALAAAVEPHAAQTPPATAWTKLSRAP
ncbi:MAG TPA: COX15/CtaA family protein [Caldilineaceae bacterium]|nr:COX15/CtaA family protein [Caldilineaceae bacterium]